MNTITVITKNNKERIKKIGLIFAFLGLVLAFSIAPISYANESETFNTSNLPEKNIKITFQGNTLIFESFPEGEEFNYIKLFLYSEDEKNYLEKYVTPSNIIYPITGVPDGTYYIQIYRAPQKYSTYWSYMWKKTGIKITIQNGIVSYVDSPVLEHNKKLYESNFSDEVSLKYYLEASRRVESDNEAIIQLAQSIVNENDSDYEKLRKVHDWVCNNVWYDYDAYYTGDYGDTSALAVLQSKRSVCAGYANLTAALLRALGIPTKIISGYALGLSTANQWTDELITTDKTNHAWNEAYVNGRWIMLDTTWNSNNRYENGVFSKNTGLDGYRYFDPTLEMFSYDHKIIDNEPCKEEFERILLLGDYVVDTEKVVLYKDGEKDKTKNISIYYDENIKMKDDIKVTYLSENTDIATVSEEGVVSAKGIGKTVIIVKTSLGGFTKEDKIKVTVKETSLKLKKYVNEMKVGKSTTFKVSTSGIKKVKWTSSNSSIATVSSTGKVKAKKVGTVYITVSGGGCKEKIKLKIVKK